MVYFYTENRISSKLKSLYFLTLQILELKAIFRDEPKIANYENFAKTKIYVQVQRLTWATKYSICDPHKQLNRNRI